MSRIIIILPFLILCFQSFSAATGPFPSIAFVKGDAYVYDLEANERKAVKGDTLKEGEVLRTTKEALMIISLKERVKVKIGPSSVVELENLLSQNEENSDQEGSLFIHAGHVFVDFFKKLGNPKLNINTKYTSLGVRGTQFFVHMEYGDESKYTMAVKEGSVALKSKSAASEQVVAAGQGSILDPNGELSPNTQYDWIENLNWNFDPSKGSLLTEEKVFLQIRQNWENYSKKVIQKRDSYFKSQRDKFNRYKR